MAQWMVYVVIVSLILGAAALSAERALRLRRAATRWVWVAAIVASLIVPTIIASVAIQIPNITRPSTPAKPIILRDVTSLPLTALLRVPLPSTTSQAGENLNAQLNRYWLIASGAMLLLIAASAAQLFWRKRRWSRSTLNGVSVFVAPGVGPAVVGLVRPCIVVPQWVVDSPPSRQAHVIAHEQSHLIARDPLLLTIAICLLVFMPWNLPLWWHLRRLRRAIEVDCDARVLGAGHDVTRYGETLIEVGQRQSAFIGTVAAMSESKSFLEQRIRIMLSKPGSSWRVAAALLGCVSVCLIAVAAQVSPPNSNASTHEVAAVDPSVYDSYVGNYKLSEAAVFTVSRNGDRLLVRLTGQKFFEIFPSSKTEYFAKIVKARINFDTDAQGRATALTLHQNGQSYTAPRMDTALAQQIDGAMTARVQSQQPTPGSEAAMLRMYSGMLAGKPNYDEMSPGLAEAVRQQLANSVAFAQSFGAIQTIDFRGVSKEGWDVYDLHHENGVSTFRIQLSSDGKTIEAAFFGPGP